VVRGIAIFILCPPLEYLGWVAGNAIRKLVMPDFVITDKNKVLNKNTALFDAISAPTLHLHQE
jgi:hypothetical protein